MTSPRIHSPRVPSRFATVDWAALVDGMPDAVIIVDASENVRYANRSAHRMFRHDEKTIVGKSLSTLLAISPHGTEEGVQQTLENAKRTTHTRRLFLGLRPNGQTFPTEAGIGLVEVDGQSMFSIVLRDVSARFRSDADRAELLSRARAAVARADRVSARASLLVRYSDLAADSLYSGGMLTKLPALCVPELARMSIVDVLVDGGIERHFAARPDADSDIVTGVVRMPKMPPGLITRPALVSGRHTLYRHGVDDSGVVAANDVTGMWKRIDPISYMCVPLQVDGRIYGAIAAIAGAGDRRYDASDLELLGNLAARVSQTIDVSQSLENSQQSAALRDETLAVVSHDLRNPVAAISRVLAQLDRPGAPREDRESLLQIARDSTDWLQRLLEDLIDVTSIGAGRFSIDADRIDPVVSLMRANVMFEPLFASRGIEFVVDMPAELPPVLADGHRILQVIANLLSNAAKFTPEGGRVRMTARATGGEVVVTVADTGSGISPSDLPRVFDRFWRGSNAKNGSENGSGLGLHIAKAIMQAHGGRLWAESEAGNGATFSFALPAIPQRRRYPKRSRGDRSRKRRP